MFRPLLAVLALSLGLALACDHPFYPVREGATWQYRSSGAGFSSEMSRSISTVTEQGFSELVVTDGVRQEVSWRCDEDGLQMLDYASGVEGFTFETLNVSGVSYPPAEAWTVGANWENTFEVSGRMAQEGMELTVSGTVANQERIVAQEEVTVEAGTFDAYRVETTTTMAMLSNVMGMNMPMNMTLTTVSWYVEGVGMVRQESDPGMGVGTFVTELVSYTVP